MGINEEVVVIGRKVELPVGAKVDVVGLKAVPEGEKLDCPADGLKVAGAPV